MKKINFWSKPKLESDAYLKYEEGEVIPVKTKKLHYPPFLNENDNEDGVDGDESVHITQFKDLVKQEASKKRHNEHNGPADVDPDVQKFKETYNFHGSLASPKTNLDTKSPKSKWSLPKLEIGPLAAKVVWMAVLLALLYTFFPIFSYYVKETPQLLHSEKMKLVNTTSKATNSATKTVTNSVKDTASNVQKEASSKIKQISKGSGLIATTEAHLTPNLPSTINSNPEVAQMTKDQWLSLISQTQNDKQKILMQLRDETNSYLQNGMSQSLYRMDLQGYSQQALRLEEDLGNATAGQNTKDVAPVVSTLNTEIEQLKGLSEDLSYVSMDGISGTFNSGVQEQNSLNAQYQSQFKSLLKTFGYSYTDNNGVIQYAPK